MQKKKVTVTWVECKNGGFESWLGKVSSSPHPEQQLNSVLPGIFKLLELVLSNINNWYCCIENKFKQKKF